MPADISRKGSFKMAKETSRTNGAKSNGPVTSDGKAKSSLNAVKHGLTSSRIVVMQNESKEDYAKLVAGFVDTFKPATEPEVCLVEEMANAQWKRRRAERIETALLDLSLNEMESKLDQVFDGPVDEDMKLALAYRDAHHGDKSLANLERHIVRLSRQFQRAHDKLVELQQIRKSETGQEAEAALEAQAGTAEKAQSTGKIVKFQNEPASWPETLEENVETPDFDPGEAA